MRVTLIASDEASAPLYRVRLLARMLMRRFEVEVLGFNFGSTDPLAPRDFPYREIPARPGVAFLSAARELANRATGDLIYAMKPRPSSYGVALALGRRRGLPVVVDIDDWEPYMVHPYSRHPAKNLVFALPRLHQPNAYPYVCLADRAIGRADGITVVSRFFQRRYGGVLAPQYVDTDRFDPGRFDREEIRRELGLAPGEAAVVFGGIAQPNKGVGRIVEALQQLGCRPWRLIIAGPRTPYAEELARDPRVTVTGTVPPEATPRYLSAADLVILPQRDEPASAGQMPMKLFEAMAMALPVVATAMADIPEVLAGCGLVVPPDDLGALVCAVDALLSDEGLRRSLGRSARERCVTRYSWEVGAGSLAALFERVVDRRRPEGRAAC